MHWTPETLFAAATAAVAFLAGVLVLIARSKRTRSVGRRMAHGPANLRFTCAGCSGQFTHSRRTLAAWVKGGRSFYCSACNTRFRGELPPKLSRFASRHGRGAGCLGLAVLLVTLPVGLALVVLHFVA